MNQVNLQPGYVLHRRPFQNTSLIVDFFTRDYGRISAVVRGGRQQSRKRRWQLEPFQPLLLSWSGRNELKQLHSAEGDGVGRFYQGEALFCAMYVNELLERSLKASDVQTAIFQYYVEALTSLSLLDDRESILRRFEYLLLFTLGYAPDFERDSASGVAISALQSYRLIPQQGFIAVALDKPGADCFEGELLLSLRSMTESQLLTDKMKPAAKRLMRQLLPALLGGKPLQSRKLFQKP